MKYLIIALLFSCQTFAYSDLIIEQLVALSREKSPKFAKLLTDQKDFFEKYLAQIVSSEVLFSAGMIGLMNPSAVNQFLSTLKRKWPTESVNHLAQTFQNYDPKVVMEQTILEHDLRFLMKQVQPHIPKDLSRIASQIETGIIALFQPKNDEL